MEGEGVQKPEKSIEKIRAAALTYKGETFEARNHGDAFYTLRKKHPDIRWFEESDGFKEGFVTTTGRFVSRQEANRIASAADQIPDPEKDRDSLSAEWLKKE